MKNRTIRLANQAEKEILKYKDDTALWMKHCTGQDADPHQQLAIMEIEEHPNAIIVWPPRFGKTWSMEAVNLRDLFCYPKESLLLFGPKQDQANNALREHLDWIEGSELLKSYLAMKRGKRQFSETKYELLNGSRAKTMGILGQIDSEEASIIRGEEFDDMDLERWNDRVLSRGGRKNRSGKPTRYRLSGTIQKGKGNIFQMMHSGLYHVVSQFNIYHGLEFGIYDENAINLMKAEMTDDEWLRIFLLIFTEAKNFIWESYLNKCIEAGFRIGWDGVEYRPGGEYKPQGIVYAGFDCGHSGMKKQRSVYRLELVEYVGSRALWLNGFEWDPTDDPDKIKRELVDIWRYYQVSGGYGDALKANFIAEINDALYDQGLTSIDRSKNPENKPPDWVKWALAPMWNSGKFKYLAASETKKMIEHSKLFLPYFHRKDDRHIAKMMRRLVRCLLNVRSVDNKTSYPSLEIIKPQLGDDAFDALNMATICANDRQIAPVDFSKAAASGPELETGQMADSMLGELLGVGGEAGFEDF